MSNGDDGNSNNDPALMTLGGQSLIQNTIIWDSYPGGETIYYDNELRVEYSIIEGLNGNFVANGGYSFQFEGNASNDPLLNDDLSFQSGSPAIDLGNPNGFYNDSDGTRNDIGNSGGNGIFVTPNSFNFGNVGIGNNAPTENFYIYNLKGGSVILGSYSTTDNQFTVTSPVLPVTIQSFEKRSFNVQFLATSLGDQTSTIELSFSNLSNNNGSFSAVGTAYTVPSGDIHVPGDVPTIQAAIDIISPGNNSTNKNIVVAPGCLLYTSPSPRDRG